MIKKNGLTAVLGCSNMDKVSVKLKPSHARFHDNNL